MKAVLGIDAAWTAAQSSGVALVTRAAAGWKLIAVAESFEQFLSFADRSGGGSDVPMSPWPSARELLNCAKDLGGSAVDLVAVDMPMPHAPIVARRASDDAVSAAHGESSCLTHSPGAMRPASMSDDLVRAFADAGYPLRTTQSQAPALIEVCPHPTLVAIANVAEQFLDDTSKAAFSPTLTKPERRARLHAQLHSVARVLEGQIAGVLSALSGLEMNVNDASLQAYGEKLDTIMCAWVGVCALEGRAAPFGDDESALWMPSGAALEV